MVFAKNEIIELHGGKKHIVVDTTKYENSYYYYVCEVNNEKNKIIDNFKIITTVNENGSLFVRTINGSLKDILIEIFKNNLNI